MYDDGGRELYRLDLALPELRYAAEYDGEEFHTADDDRAHDEQRRDWLDVHRHWTVDVFKKHDVYGPTAAAPTRLTQGGRRGSSGASLSGTRVVLPDASNHD